MRRNRSVNVEKLYFDFLVRIFLAALVTIYVGFPRCFATGLFLDAATPVVGLDPISVFVYIGPTDVQLSGPGFLSHYPASSLGIKICTPAYKPRAI